MEKLIKTVKPFDVLAIVIMVLMVTSFHLSSKHQSFELLKKGKPSICHPNEIAMKSDTRIEPIFSVSITTHPWFNFPDET